MRFGAHVFDYQNSQQWVRRHCENGYGAAYWPLPLDASGLLVDEYLHAARSSDLVISEVGVWNNVLTTNGNAKRQIDDAINAVRLADYLGAKCCINITGSLSDTWDGPHPENMSVSTFARVVEIIRHIIDTAAPTRTYFTPETMPWMIPNSIESMQALLRAVNRKRFAVHVDMCNLINSFDKVYNNAAYTTAFFNAFGDRIKAVHAKDLVLSNQLTLQITETICGEGIFDFDALLQACAGLEEDLPIMTEHLVTQEQYAQSTGFLQHRAKKLNLTQKTAVEWKRS